MRTSVDVHNFLLERDVPHEFVRTRGRLREPERLAAVLGLPPNQVGKVELFEASRGRLVAALVPAGRSADPRKVARAIPTATLQEVGPDRTTDLTEYLPEALPPVGLPNGTVAIVDRSLSDQEILYFPGGETSSVLKIRAGDLVRATSGKVARVAR
ncbi:MAG TPA: YbaK/EbsC family protein [Actinomycetota bacterium]|nr:YbaK/EbsC family protein [Actinomycetota bacterium]